MTINPKTIIALASILAAAWAGHALTKNHYVRKEQAALIEQQAATLAWKEWGDAIVAKFADADAKAKEKQRVRIVTVTKEIEKPVYSECRPTADGWLQLREAVREANGKSSPAARVPADPRTNTP